jgi:energy-coupling factor transport system substrate-specific component
MMTHPLSPHDQGRAAGRRRWRRALLGALLLLIVAATGGAAQGPEQGNRAGIVVDFGDGVVYTSCVDLGADGQATGEEVLASAGFDVLIEYSPMGGAVCKIGNQGCNFPGQPCWCECMSSPCVYWSYNHLQNGQWSYSSLGASSYIVRAGAVEGWAWGAGTVAQGAAPPLYSFDQLCAAPTATPTWTAVPTNTPPPTATWTPWLTNTPLPTATSTWTPIPSSTALAALPSFTPTATPSGTPSPTPTGTPTATGTATLTPTSSPTTTAVALAALPDAPLAAATPTPSDTPPATATPESVASPEAAAVSQEATPTASATATPQAVAAVAPVARAPSGRYRIDDPALPPRLDPAAGNAPAWSGDAALVTTTRPDYLALGLCWPATLLRARRWGAAFTLARNRRAAITALRARRAGALPFTVHRSPILGTGEPGSPITDHGWLRARRAGALPFTVHRSPILGTGEPGSPITDHGPGGSARWLSGAIYGLTAGIGLLALLHPFIRAAIQPEAGAATAVNTPLMMTVLVALCFLALLFEVQGQTVSAKVIALLGVLVAINSVLRFVEVSIPGPGGFTPVFFLIMLTGYVFGARLGFLMGALTLLVSALITGGIGPWLPGQMFTAGWMGLLAPLAWLLLRLLRGRPGSRRELWLLAVFAGLGGLFFGVVINLWFWPYMVGPADQYWQAGVGLAEAVRRYAVYYVATSLLWDLFAVGGNVLLMLVFGAATLRALRRFRQRFEFEYQPRGGLDTADGINAAFNSTSGGRGGLDTAAAAYSTGGGRGGLDTAAAAYSTSGGGVYSTGGGRGGLDTAAAAYSTSGGGVYSTGGGRGGLDTAAAAYSTSGGGAYSTGGGRGGLDTAAAAYSTSGGRGGLDTAAAAYSTSGGGAYSTGGGGVYSTGGGRGGLDTAAAAYSTSGGGAYSTSGGRGGLDTAAAAYSTGGGRGGLDTAAAAYSTGGGGGGAAR